MERWSPGRGRRLKVEFVFVLTFRDNSSFGLNSLGGSVVPLAMFVSTTSLVENLHWRYSIWKYFDKVIDWIGRRLDPWSWSQMRCDQIRSVLKCLAQKRQGVPTFYKAPACPLTQGLVGSFLKVCGPPSLVSHVHNHLPGIDDSLWGPAAPLKTPSLISQLVGLTPCYHERMGPPKNSMLKHFPGKDLPGCCGFPLSSKQ